MSANRDAVISARERAAFQRGGDAERHRMVEAIDMEKRAAYERGREDAAGGGVIGLCVGVLVGVASALAVVWIF